MDKYYLNGVPTQVNLMKMMLKCIQGRDKAIVVRSKGYKEKADGFSNDTYGYAPGRSFDHAGNVYGTP